MQQERMKKNEGKGFTDAGVSCILASVVLYYKVVIWLNAFIHFRQ